MPATPLLVVIGALALARTLWSSADTGLAQAGPVASPIRSTYLSDVPWTVMTNGSGPVERDRSNGATADGDGHTLSIDGATYAKGLGVRAPSDVRYDLTSLSSADGNCTTFISDAGVDDESGGRGSVVFQVWAADAKLYDSGVIAAGSPAQHVALDVLGKHELGLVVAAGGDGSDFVSADWADARMLCDGGLLEATVDRTIDGDSLDTHVLGKRTAVGYLGVETPQLNEPCGPEAFARNRELADKGVLLEADPAYELNSRGLRLYYAYTTSGTSIDEVLVSDGLGRAVRTDASQGDHLAALEREAQEAMRGCLWSGAASP